MYFMRVSKHSNDLGEYRRRDGEEKSLEGAAEIRKVERSSNL